jgi:serine/threonine protein kinase
VSIPNEAQIYLGKVFAGRFEVREFLAEGGFCLVFKGLDSTTGKDVAIKILKIGARSPDIMEFENEVALLQLLHRATNVVTLVESGEDAVLISTVPAGAFVPILAHYLVLELADASLDELVLYRDKLSFVRRLELFRDVVLGAHQMHTADVVHRDVKAENCLVFQQPKKSVVKLTDLGRSKRLSEPTRFLAEDYINGRGDIRFAPPEALWGQIGPDETSMRRADLYLLGSVVYELALGQAITAVAIGTVVARNIAGWARGTTPLARATDYNDKLREIAARYEYAFQLFEEQVPAAARDGATDLLRRLCNPDPALREHLGRAGASDKNLTWVLNRTDILIKSLRYAEREAKALAAKKLRGRAK